MKSEWDFIAKYISELDTSTEESEEELSKAEHTKSK